MKEQYVHVGKQPILLHGKAYEYGDSIVAEPSEMVFFLQIGAVEKKTVPTPEGQPFNTKGKA